MIKEYEDIIEAICVRLNYAVTPFDILAWLENFEVKDWPKALTVLEHFEYYSTKDIIKEFEDGFTLLKKYTGEKDVYLLPVKGPGKSGMAMIYYLKKTPSCISRKFKILNIADIEHLPEKCNIVLVDDFAGTGNSIVEFYEEIRSGLPHKHYTFVLTVAYQERAEKQLLKKRIRIFGNKKSDIFSNPGSVFGYYPKMKAIREFCYLYGQKLYPKQDKSEDSKESKHTPLGFGNTRALIGFEHTVPNNTLPIFWADRKIEGTSKKWVPLFPRRSAFLIDKARQGRKEMNYWLSLLFRMKFDQTIFSQKERTRPETLQLISLLFLKKQRKNVQFILEMLSMNRLEYEILIKRGIEKGLLDENEQLTSQALTIYNEIDKKRRYTKTKNSRQLKMKEDILYIPEKFRGFDRFD